MINGACLILSVDSCLDAISESNPRIIHEDRARKLANELKRCTYYETCATYGLNVERVFHDGSSCRLNRVAFLHHCSSSVSESDSATLWLLLRDALIESVDHTSDHIDNECAFVEFSLSTAITCAQPSSARLQLA